MRRVISLVEVAGVGQENRQAPPSGAVAPGRERLPNTANPPLREENGEPHTRTPLEVAEGDFSRDESVPFELPWTPGTLEHRQIYAQTARSLSPMHPPPRLRASRLDLPDYIKPVPQSLGADDIEYLQKKGAFTLPEVALRDECLRCFALYVQPLYPVVDFVQIWSVTHAPSSANRGKLSLLLMQAILFAGAMWADVKLVRGAGFLSRKALRQSLHERIRVLYDADYEEDRMTVVQSLLLRSFWWKEANEQKDGWHWVGVAFSVARSIDLDCAGTDQDGSNRALRHRRKQLWWALCNREVIASCDMGRAPRVRDDEQTVPVLNLDDFHYDGITSGPFCGMACPTEGQHLILARISVEFVKLNRIFNKILETVCRNKTAIRTTGLRSAEQMEDKWNHVFPRRGLVNVADLIACDEELSHWRQQVPGDLWHAGPLPSDITEWRRAELSHRAMLCITYHTALMTLHRPQVLPSRSTTTGTPGAAEQRRKQESRTRMRHSAQEITRTAMHFFNADHLVFLPATVVSSLMPVSISHTLDLFCHDDETVRTKAAAQLDQCRAMLYILAERQHAPAWVLQTVEYILSRAKQHEASRDSSRHHQHAARPEDEEKRGHLPLTSQEGRFRDRRGSEMAHPRSPHPRPSSPGSSLRSVDSPSAEAPANGESEQPTAAAIPSNMNACQQPDYTSSFFNVAEGWLDFQFPSSAVPTFDLEFCAMGAVEDPWLDFTHLPETMAGSSWPMDDF
ncbi:hypothetical protein LTS17_005325 [Exophiala oligosperma]